MKFVLNSVLLQMSGTETSVGDVINPFNILNHQVLHLIGGNDDLRASDEAFDNGG